jgi:hypothetical protein
MVHRKIVALALSHFAASRPPLRWSISALLGGLIGGGLRRGSGRAGLGKGNNDMVLGEGKVKAVIELTQIHILTECRARSSDIESFLVFFG